MSVAFDHFFLMVSMAKPLAVELSTWIGVAGCGCPSLRSKVRIGTASWPLMYAEPISVSAAESIPFDIICEMEWMGPLKRGRLTGGVVMSGCLSERKMCPPAQLRACGLERYEASLCM